MELGALSQLLEKLSFAVAAYCAQVLLTISRTVKHTEEPDEGNPHVRFEEGEGYGPPYSTVQGKIAAGGGTPYFASVSSVIRTLR